MVVTIDKSLNITPGTTAPLVVHCSQGDTGLRLSFGIMAGTEQYDPTGCIASAHGVRQDGTGWGPVECAIEDKRIVLDFPSAATAVRGTGMAEITISKGGTSVGTANFAIMVEAAIFPAGATASDDMSVYQAILGYTQKLGSPLIAETAADMTDTARTYVYTGTETGYTNGNWYYYDGESWASGGIYGSVALEGEITRSVAAAQAAQMAAESAATAAAASEGSVEDSATVAHNAAVTATNAANTATVAAGTAGSSASTAQDAANTAAQKASEASASAASAAQSKQAAETAASDAEDSASSAESDASAAAQSASNAAGSASTASAAASTAASKASEAAQSATTASGAADTATTKASEAAASAAAAAQSAASMTVDSALSATSTNPVQNKVITAEVGELKNDLHQAIEDFAVPTQEAVDNWLDDHPEATTTVQDGSLTETKFSEALKVKAIKDYVTPQMFGGKGDGIADDTASLQAAINSNKPIYVPDGVYIVSSPLTWAGPCMLEMSDGAIIRAKENSNLRCLLGIRTDGTVYNNAENEYIRGGTFDGNYCCDVVIGINYCRGKISDCTIQGVKNIGLYIRHNLTNAGVGQGSLRVLDVIVKNTNAVTGTTGIYSAGNDNYIRAITQNMEIGISANTGETLESCHAWIGSANIFENSTAFVVRGLYCILSNCTSDTMRYGVKIYENGGRLSINGFLYYHNTAVATANILSSYQCVVFDFASISAALISNAVINLADAVAKVVSDNVIGSKLVKVTNLTTVQAGNAVSANIPNDIASYADTVISFYNTSGNITQNTIDDAIPNTVMRNYCSITGYEGWAIVITIGSNTTKVQAIIIQGKGTFVRRYTSGAWNAFS